MDDHTNRNWEVLAGGPAFQALREDWDHLFFANPEHSPFMSWGWVSAWMQFLAADHEPCILTLRDGSGSIQIIIPLVASCQHSLIFPLDYSNACGFGPECSDHLSILRLPELDPDLGRLVADGIRCRLGNQCRIRFTAFDSRLGQLLAIAEAFDSCGQRTVREQQTVCPVLQLPDTWDALAADMSRNFRSQVNRSWRRILEDEQVSFESVAMNECQAFTARLIELNRTRMDDKNVRSTLESGDFRKFLAAATENMAVQQLAWMDYLTKDGEVIGASLNFVHGDTIYYYMGGFLGAEKALSPGNALFAHVIRRGIEAGYKTYDFLRGAEHYKYRWGASNVPLDCLTVYPQRSLPGSVAWLLHKTRLKIRKQ